MGNENVIERIEAVCPRERVLRNEPMSAHTSFRIGGPADALVLVDNEEELSAVLGIVKDAEHLILGNGSNFLVADEGYPGIMVKLGEGFSYAEKYGETSVRAGGAATLSSVSSCAMRNGLAGFEFASGIPGSVGGAMFMNAGAYGGEMKDIVRSVRLMSPDGAEVITRTADEMEFAYRNSALQSDGYIATEAVFDLEASDEESVRARVMELQEKRNSKQPVNFPSAGSTFKRPAGGYAAALIDEAGLRGFAVGGAQVSEKHTGFVVNKGGATCDDVLSVMRHVRDTVYEKSGIMLEPEVRLINCGL